MKIIHAPDVPNRLCFLFGCPKTKQELLLKTFQLSFEGRPTQNSPDTLLYSLSFFSPSFTPSKCYSDTCLLTPFTGNQTCDSLAKMSPSHLTRRCRLPAAQGGRQKGCDRVARAKETSSDFWKKRKKEGREGRERRREKLGTSHILTLVRGACANIENPSKIYSWSSYSITVGLSV